VINSPEISYVPALASNGPQMARNSSAVASLVYAISGPVGCYQYQSRSRERKDHSPTVVSERLHRSDPFLPTHRCAQCHRLHRFIAHTGSPLAVCGKTLFGRRISPVSC
jgi:hypothetical protein